MFCKRAIDRSERAKSSHKKGEEQKMSKLKNTLIGWSCVLLLGSIGVFMNSCATTAELHAAPTTSPVTIGGPLPLPTTAAQNGAWNVGISGTPSVNVANTPGVNINNTPSVNIAGTPNVNVSSTVAIRNVDEKGRIPYMQTVFQNCNPSSALCDTFFPLVPDGMRLVVEHVSANIGLNPGSALNGTFLLVAGGVQFSLPGHSMASPNVVGVNEQVLAYYEAGQQPVYRLALSTPGDSGVVSSVISGYLINLSQ
jgi:hypothetical protein